MNRRGAPENLRRGSAPLDPASYDEAVVQLLLLERPVRARPPDYWEAVRRLNRERYSDGQIAHRLRKTRKTVERIRHRIGVPAVTGRYDGPWTPRDAPTRPKRMG